MAALGFIGLGLLLGVAAGGRPGNLGRLELENWHGLALALFVVQAASRAGYVPFASQSAQYIWSLSGLVLVSVLMRQRDALMGLCASGILLNVLAVAVNGGMPFAIPDFWPEKWIAVIETGEVGFYHPVGPGTFLTLFSDVAPTPLPSLVSIGDVVMVVGVVAYIVREASRRVDERVLAQTSTTR